MTTPRNWMRSGLVYAAIGVSVGALHFLACLLLALYFGLSFSREGAWFVTHLALQPGTATVAFLETSGWHAPEGADIAVNFAAYTLAGSVVAGA